MYRPPVYFEPKIRVREESNKILVFGWSVNILVIPVYVYKTGREKPEHHPDVKE